MNIGVLLPRAARHRPDAVALRHGETVRSYREFADRVLRLARALLDLGLGRGDRVAIVQSNRPELLESLYAGLCAGLVVVPINARLHPREILYVANHSGSKALVHSEEFNASLDTIASDLTSVGHRISTRPSGSELDFEALVAATRPLKQVADVAPDELAWLFYTSGTTGRPKGVMLSHRVLRIALMNFLADIYSFQPQDVVLHAAPLTHGSGNVALAATARGASNVILHTPSFEPAAVWELVERWKVTAIAFLAPTQIVKLLLDDECQSHDLSSLRFACYGGGPVYVEDLKRALDRFGPIWVQIFGQGEAPMTISCLTRHDHVRWMKEDERRLGSAGIPRTDVEVRVVDERSRDVPPGMVGEIAVRGDVVMAGYWNDPEATAFALRNGWLHTGDLGTFDELGYLYILDRSKDMIVSGGHNIYPREVEEVLMTHPGVAEVAVIGIPDDHWGESVHAVIVPRPGVGVSVEEIQAHCLAHLAGYKKPRSVEIVTELPRNPNGKVLKRVLREPHWHGYERRVGGGHRRQSG